MVAAGHKKEGAEITNLRAPRQPIEERHAEPGGNPRRIHQPSDALEHEADAEHRDESANRKAHGRVFLHRVLYVNLGVRADARKGTDAEQIHEPRAARNHATGGIRLENVP